MSFWIIAGALSIAAGLWVCRAAIRAQGTDARPNAAYDLDLYRAQLRELDRDLARGTIAAAEAERARVEISRRILEADRALTAEQGAGQGSMLWVAGGMGLALVFAVAVYGWIGAPGYPDQPLAARLAEIEEIRAARPTQEEAEAAMPAPELAELSSEDQEALNQLRARMERDSDDAEGWFQLARTEAQIGNYRPARLAQERGIAVLGDQANARAWLDLARLQILAVGGATFTPEAERSLNQALARDPTQGDARYLLGVMYQRQERPDLAFRIWRDLLAVSGPDDPWVGPILGQIEGVAALSGQRLDPSLVPEALSEPADAIRDLSPEDQLAAIEAMVEGLAARLASEGGPPEDWARLIVAYTVMGRGEQAQAILAEARGVFASDPAAMEIFDAVAEQLAEGAE